MNIEPTNTEVKPDKKISAETGGETLSDISKTTDATISPTPKFLKVSAQHFLSTGTNLMEV